MTVGKLGIALGMLVVSAGVAACDSNDESGTLQQNWTIAGTTNPTACGSATQMRLVIVDSAGVAAATNFATCASFQTSVVLAPNDYTGTATFLNAEGLSVSKTLLIPPFAIADGLTTVRTLDFALADLLIP